VRRFFIREKVQEVPASGTTGFQFKIQLTGLRDGMNTMRNAASAILLLLMISIPAMPQEPSQRIQTLYAEARADEQAHHLDLATEKYQAILKLDPKLAAAHNNLGRLYFQQNRFDEAVPELTRACNLAPNSAVPRALLGFSLFQKGEFTSAQRELKIALRLNPGDANAKLFLARSLIETGDLRAAVELLEQLRQHDPHNVEALYSLGTVYSTLAASTLGEIQTVEPRSYLVELLLGEAAETKQILPDAVEHYKRAIAKAPDDSELYYLYAHSLWETGNTSDALTAYRKSLSLAPYDPATNWEAARILVTEDPQEALRLVDRAVERNPEVPQAQMVRGKALMLLQRPKEAVDAFRKASSLDPDDAAPHFQLARAYRQMGLTNEASAEEALFDNMQKEYHASQEQKQSQ
jgi:tetratricopeptide (TPR) repeat protein